MEPTLSGPKSQPSERTRYGTLSFEPPEGWKDRQIVIYEGPTYVRDGLPTSLVLTSEKRDPGQTLQAYALEGLVELTKGREDFKLIETGELRVGGRPAMKVRYAFRTARGELEQTLVHVEAPDDVMITITCTSMPCDSGPSLAVLEQVLLSARFAHAPAGAPAETLTARTNPVPPSSTRVAQFDFAPPQMVPMPGAFRRP